MAEDKQTTGDKRKPQTPQQRKRDSKARPKVTHLDVRTNQPPPPEETAGEAPAIVKDPLSLADFFDVQTPGAEAEVQDRPEEGEKADSPYIVTDAPMYAPEFDSDGAPKSASKNGAKPRYCKALVFTHTPVRSFYETKITEKLLHEKGITPAKDARGGWIYPVVIDKEGNWSNYERGAVPLMASSHAVYRATHWPQHRTIASQDTGGWPMAVGVGIIVIVVLLLILIFLLVFFFFI